MLSNMLRKAAFGAQLFEKGSDESLNSEKSMDTAGKHSKNRINWTRQMISLCSQLFKETLKKSLWIHCKSCSKLVSDL